MSALNIVVEGATDAAVLRRIIAKSGGEIGFEAVTRGKGKLDREIARYSQASKRQKWLIVRDLDNDADCAPNLLRRLRVTQQTNLCLRIAVRSIEAWLLADRAAFARFVKIDAAQVPPYPDQLANPKTEVVRLGAMSSDATIRSALCPTAESKRQVGPEYESCLIEFATRVWDPRRVARSQCSDSFDRTFRRVQQLVAA